MNETRDFLFEVGVEEMPPKALAEMIASFSSHLQQALEQLPEKTRLPLVMYFFDGASVKTVARRLNMSASGVYQRLRTGISQLHSVMVSKETQND